MVQKYHHLLEFIPFVLSSSSGMPKMNLTRLAETAIIALVTAGVVMYSTQKVIETEMRNITVNHQNAEIRTIARFREMKMSISRIETNFLNHVEKHNGTATP